MKFKFSCVAALAAIIAAGTPAAAQVRIDVQSTYPTRLLQLGTLSVSLADKLKEIAPDEVRLRVVEPGALVPAGEAFDAASAGSIDAYWSSPGFWTGKDVAFALFAAVPFGPEASELIAWYYKGGGAALNAELYGKYNLVSMPCGISAPEASGWFRKEIASKEDLKGLKMRFFGLGAKVMQRLGVATQSLPAGEIFQALQLGTIDATEFGMPAMDLELGFHQVAKFYYFPGWHQPATLLELTFNKAKWEKLSDRQRRLIEIACGDNIRESLALGESAQVDALKAFESKGVKIKSWSPEFLELFRTEWDAVVEEEKARSAMFAKVWKSYSAFREGYATWSSLAYPR
ncbi:MAG: TRAP transporter substrate-binding protein [Hyphomicrobiaceae bacterium]|nr:TRAP transporter substrate-binding protein [Hyphomicrobiaceae bacterium]